MDHALQSHRAPERRAQRYAQGLLVVVAAALVTACGALGGREQPVREADRHVGVLSEVETHIGELNAQLDQTINALHDVTAAARTGADATQAFGRFTAAHDGTVRMRERLGRQTQELRSRTDEYFGRWQEDVEQTQNPQLRQVSQERRAEAMQVTGRLLASTASLDASLEPLLRDLQDVRFYLQRNLTPDGIAAVSGTIRNVQQHASQVRQDLGAVRTHVAPARHMFATQPEPGRG
jgi:glycerol-3-phosphate O-acyltransferase